MLRQPARIGRSAAGFSLIELMVALVVGLIVIGAVLALIVSMIRANNQTIQATRLTQELRATAMVVAADLKRARGVSDPFAAAKVPIADIDTIDVSTPGCIIYGYQGGAGGDYRVIHLDANNKVVLGATNTAANATCALAGNVLSSAQVRIDSMTFSLAGREINVTLTGSLASPNSGTDEITRTLTQIVFIRSVGS
jgi:prepilin-type N-terminal cleavage/methylation domain-containing protein